VSRGFHIARIDFAACRTASRRRSRGPLAPVVASALLLLSAALATAASAEPAGSGLVAPADVCPDASAPALPSTRQLRLLACLVNYARRSQGLRPLSLSPALARAGALRLADEVRCGELSHTACGHPFLLVFEESGYLRGARSYSVGENLAWGQSSNGSPRRTMIAWLESGPHRRILLDPSWRQMGLAFSAPAAFRGRGHVTLWVAEFGARRDGRRVYSEVGRARTGGRESSSAV
jgi:hypothetical protein